LIPECGNDPVTKWAITAVYCWPLYFQLVAGLRMNVETKLPAIFSGKRFSKIRKLMPPKSSALFATALALVGCAAGSASSPVQPSPVQPSPSQAAAITTQPASQVVPIGATATFTVTATGTAPLSYQWSENGSEIPGATSASYTTVPVALPANGSTAVGSFQVTVSNAANSVTSSVASLTAGARAPKPGDVRYLAFEQVSLPGFMSTYGAGANNLLIEEFSFPNTLGTPLWLGNSVIEAPCGWHFSYYPLPTPMDNMAMSYQEGFLNDTSVASYLQSVAAPYKVITSMDIQPQASCQAMGVSWVESAQGGFDQRLEVVSPAQIQAQTTADGQASRIVTAVSFDASGNANLLSYGWTGDTTTVYETKTYLVPPAEVGSTATALAADGYFISAFGGNDADGYVLVGARVQGDTLPRPMNINGALAPQPDSSVYFTPVVMLSEVLSGTTVAAWEQ
jgi:hypothetical protein